MFFLEVPFKVKLKVPCEFPWKCLFLGVPLEVPLSGPLDIALKDALEVPIEGPLVIPLNHMPHLGSTPWAPVGVKKIPN